MKPQSHPISTEYLAKSGKKLCVSDIRSTEWGSMITRSLCALIRRLGLMGVGCAGEEVVLCKQGVCLLKQPLKMHGSDTAQVLREEEEKMSAGSVGGRDASCLQIHAHFEAESGDVRFRVTRPK